MTPTRSVSTTIKPWKVVIALLLAVMLGLYVSGYFFLWAIHAKPYEASLLAVLRYQYYYGDHPGLRGRLTWSSVAGFGLVIIAVGLLFIPRPRPLHGEARFARRREIASAGLFGGEGIILGQVGSRYLMLDGQQGVLLAAPPRSGKGVGVVIPNLLNWPGSVVCVDIKRENWSITAGFRQAHGQACFLLDPFAEDGRTSRWNPFAYVSEAHARRINDLQRIADMLYPDPPGVDPFWTASARALFLGIALYLFETPYLPRTLGEVLRQGMASDNEGFGKHWKRIIEARARQRRPLSPECVRALYDVIDLAPVTASSIRKTFTSRLDLWLNPMLDAATAHNDFDLRGLRKEPMSIYVGVNPDDLHRLRPVLNLFFQQAIGLQTRELPEHNRELKHQVLMLLDEFTALGRIPIIADAISYLPGYNVRVLLVIQTPSQLREVYGPHAAETMVKTLAARIVYAPKDVSDAKEISEELGSTTVKSKTVSRAIFGGGKGPSVSVSEQRRALLLPQEVKDIGTRGAIVFYEGLRPILSDKIRYFEDRCFKARRIAAPCLLPLDMSPLPLADSEIFDAAGGTSKTGLEAEFDVSVRPVAPSDIARLDELDLKDFSVNFDDVVIPQGQPLDDHQLKSAVEQFLSSFTD
jgi:type IV secretion system protein VirD4